MNLRAFKAVSIPATDTKPNRIKITDLRFNQSIICGYSAEGASEFTARVEEILTKYNIPVLHKAWSEGLTQNYSLFLTNNFTNKLK